MVNEHILKITGRATLPEPLEMDKSYRIGLDIDVKTASDSSNDDGTINRTFVGRMMSCEVLKETGDVIRADVKGSQSKKLRNQIYAWGQEKHPEVDDEELYDIVMNQIRANGDVIFDRAYQKHIQK